MEYVTASKAETYVV